MYGYSLTDEVSGFFFIFDTAFPAFVDKQKGQLRPGSSGIPASQIFATVSVLRTRPCLSILH